jgi:transcriptional regulator with XRE-family HTH domain
MRRQHRMAISYSCLRKFRKFAHLSQRELAFLVGLSSQGQVSEIEAGLKHPSLGVEACCEIVFGAPLRELYPALYARAENELFEHALQLCAKLVADQSREEAAAYIAALISRLDGAHSTL